MTARLVRLWYAWQRFAFAPTDTAPMAALRIAAGVITVGWALSYLPDASFFLGGEGTVPHVPVPEVGAWAVGIGPPYLALALLALAGVALAAGLATRGAALASLVLLIAIQRRDPLTLDSGDQLLRALVFYLVLMPCGETWSVDAWLRRRRRGREPRPRAPWGLRLLQIQVSLLYLFAVWDKLRGTSWSTGTAVGLVLQIQDLQRIAVPHAVAVNSAFSALLSYGTLLTEASLVVGLWIPRVRWWVMGAGVALHLGIEATLLTGWFSLVTISCYLAFVPAPALRRAVSRVAARLPRRRPEPLPPREITTSPTPETLSRER